MGKDHSKRLLARIAILLLICAIAGLTAVAKNNKYLPKSNPAHFLDKATKMGVPHHPVAFIPVPPCPIAKVAPPRPEFRAVCLRDSEKLDSEQTRLVLSQQHRSPPALLG